MNLIIEKRNKFETKEYFIFFLEKDFNVGIRREFKSENIGSKCHIELTVYNYTI